MNKHHDHDLPFKSCQHTPKIQSYTYTYSYSYSHVSRSSDY